MTKIKKPSKEGLYRGADLNCRPLSSGYETMFVELSFDLVPNPASAHWLISTGFLFSWHQFFLQIIQYRLLATDENLPCILYPLTDCGNEIFE